MSDIILLDGSIGQELVKRAGDKPTPLWSTSVMQDRPGLTAEVHGAYFDAGATIASTNSYAVHRDRLRRDGLESDFAALIDCALTEAETARKAHDSGRIAGTLGPLGASYRPDLCPPPAEAAPLYAEIAGMMRGRVDILLIESAASVAQATGALMGCREAGLPVWLAVTVMDDNGNRLRSGERVDELADVIATYKPEAVLINCTRPEAVGAGLIRLREFGLPFGAYANGFDHITAGFLEDSPTVDALSARRDLTPELYADFAMGWIAQGATIVGGCCEVGPDHIAELAARLRSAGHTIV
ncbi:homocysteine S-methyltransferase [Roseovarius nanhaiticus]|uniref:Homocysteine S-methyltransferase n=1 Tax=Roseovarius nanhaiticus TaxID=573024 RepID=A0A1N7F6I0_9RHOB|nr:homocysteine S-methyltransferase family protein [Roseovarius nanhaiticus]SEK60731.1 homocysteine S-methyltransferase [Roseovarius nanhaiticus]SIR95909.1 homocysteine S-methyltransferase [Roseovarius nanhaiticus]